MKNDVSFKKTQLLRVNYSYSTKCLFVSCLLLRVQFSRDNAFLITFLINRNYKSDFVFIKVFFVLFVKGII